MKSYLTIFCVLILLVSCNSGIDSETYSEYQKKGNELALLSQATLLANVGKAIQKGGPEYAVEFCNLKAASIIDSLNKVNNCVISRVSAKNRNPENQLKTNSEKNIWKIFNTNTIGDTIILQNKKLVYYRPIKISMPACLKCYGNPETEISSSTLTKLHQLYPGDLATGYRLNDFRGLWKIEFNTTSK